MKKPGAVKLLIFIMILSSFSACSFGKLKKEKVTLETAKGKVVVDVEIAKSEEERTTGLMNRETVPAGTGMLFVFQDEAPRGFWMKNTKVPLDIIFFDSKMTAISTVQNMEPCVVAQCPTYLSGRPAMYALEVPKGFIQEYGVLIGDKIIERK